MFCPMWSWVLFNDTPDRGSIGFEVPHICAVRLDPPRGERGVGTERQGRSGRGPGTPAERSHAAANTAREARRGGARRRKRARNRPHKG